MVKFVHISDTHLGYREGEGVINKWAKNYYSKPYEQEIYDAFLKTMDDISKIDGLDFLVHCGDMFHVPNIDNSYPPPEPARITLEEGFDLFFKATNNRVPLIYIEGNHGVFRGYEYTPFETHINKKKFPNFYYFKERDLLNAISNKKPLCLEFPEKKTRFYLYPYFEFKSHSEYESLYDNWIEYQRPPANDDFKNIAIAHGSKSDNTLHDKVKDFDYQYIALGHEHGLQSLSKRVYYSGGLLPLNFKEKYENQGYLIVSIDDSSKELNVEKVFTDKMLKRPFEILNTEISPQDSIDDFSNKVYAELNKYKSTSGFDATTSARLKLQFTGEVTLEKTWQMEDMMSKIRRDCFSQSDKYNILQLIWKITDTSEYSENDVSPSTIDDYILESPDLEFKAFVEEKLKEDKTKFDTDKLTQFGMSAIKKALNLMDKKKEV